MDVVVVPVTPNRPSCFFQSFRLMDAVWKEMDATYMQFSLVRNEVLKRLSAALHRGGVASCSLAPSSPNMVSHLLEETRSSVAVLFCVRLSVVSVCLSVSLPAPFPLAAPHAVTHASLLPCRA